MENDNNENNDDHDTGEYEYDENGRKLRFELQLNKLASSKLR